MVLKIDYDTIKFQKVTYAVIFMTSCYRKYVIKMSSQKFSILSPSLSKILQVALLVKIIHYKIIRTVGAGDAYCIP